MFGFGTSFYAELGSEEIQCEQFPTCFSGISVLGNTVVKWCGILFFVLKVKKLKGIPLNKKNNFFGSVYFYGQFRGVQNLFLFFFLFFLFFLFVLYASVCK